MRTSIKNIKKKTMRRRPERHVRLVRVGTGRMRIKPIMINKNIKYSPTRKRAFRKVYSFMKPKRSKELPENYLYEPEYEGIKSMLYVDKNLGQAIMDTAKKNRTEKFPELHSIHKKISAESFVLDGKLSNIDEKNKLGNLMQTQSRNKIKNKTEISYNSSTNPATFIATDILEHNGHPTILNSLSDRKKILREIIPPDIKSIKVIETSNNQNQLIKQIKDKGGKEINAKKPESIYKEGEQTSDWVKKII